MRRPVCLAALLFTAAVWAAVLIHPVKERIDEKADGRSVTVTGTVEWKEYKRSSPDSLSVNMTLKNIRIESGIPAEIAFDVHESDKVLCVLTDDTALQESWAKEGAEVRVRGKLRLYRHPSNDGEFDAFLYYTQINGLLFSLRDAHILAYTHAGDPLKSRLYAVRRSLSEALDDIYGEKVPEDVSKDIEASPMPVSSSKDSGTASLMKAMLLGQTGLLDAEQKDLYQSSGIIHVLCISGVHLSLIGTGIFSLLRKTGIPIPVCSAASLTFLFLYGIMTGMHTSCVRALIMFSFQVAAKALGRTYDTMTALSVAAVLLLIEQPAYLYHSGFLFSFAAVIAISLVSEGFPKRTVPFLIPVCTMPVQLSFYYTFPLYSVFLNLIVIALAPFLIAGGMLSLLPYMLASLLSGGVPGAAAGTASGSATNIASASATDIASAGAFGGTLNNVPSLSGMLFSISRMIGKLPSLILYLFDRLCAAAEKLPFHTLIPGKPAFRLVILYYLLIAASLAVGSLRGSNENRALKFIFMKKGAVQAALITAAVVMILSIRYRPPLSLYMWNVGQGDGLCLMTHDGSGSSCILIDGGSSSRQGIGKYIGIPFLKYHGISQIDCCVVTHDDLDHCSGITELLEQHGDPDGIRIGSVALPSVKEECKGKLYLQIEDTARKKGIPVRYLYRGMMLEKGDLSLECVHPEKYSDYEDANAFSTVLLVRYRGFSAFLTGDLEGAGEQDLLDYLGQRRIDADVLKVAHHGSAGGTSPAFLSKVGARTALISCGPDNPYGHPSPETLSRLMKAGMKIYDTRRAGQIGILTDGRSGYSVETFSTNE